MRSTGRKKTLPNEPAEIKAQLAKCIGEGICRGTTTIASKQWLSQRPYFSIKGLCWVERFADLISSWWHVKGPRTTGLRWVTSWEHCSWCWRCRSSKVFVWQSSLWKIQIKHSGAKISHKEKHEAFTINQVLKPISGHCKRVAVSFLQAVLHWGLAW